MRAFFKKYGSLIVAILIPLAVGALSALLTGDAMRDFAAVEQPPLSPPGFLFPIVWTVLYILMGISSFRVWKKQRRASGLTVYAVSLVFNFFWSIFFFVCGLYLLSLIWLLVLWILVLICTAMFYKIDRPAGLLQIPYCLWCAFALYLNFGVFLLN